MCDMWHTSTIPNTLQFATIQKTILTIQNADKTRLELRVHVNAAGHEYCVRMHVLQQTLKYTCDGHKRLYLSGSIRMYVCMYVYIYIYIYVYTDICMYCIET